MSVYQVEEYYIYMYDLTISDEQHKKIEEMLNKELLIEEYEISQGEGTITVDKFEDKYSARKIEEKINTILEG